jgi:hypothetical protein
MASRYRDLNFYIFEYSELIKHQSLTSHKRINYDKKAFFKNYDEIEEIFNQDYKNILCTWSARCINHLSKMQCKFPKTFNTIHTIKKHV